MTKHHDEVEKLLDLVTKLRAQNELLHQYVLTMEREMEQLEIRLGQSEI